MYDLKYGQLITWGGERWRIAGHRGNAVRLVHPRTGEHEMASLVELYNELDPPPVLQHGEKSMDSILDEVSDEELSRAQKLAAELDTILDAHEAGSGLEELLEQWVETKDFVLRTAWRHVTAYRTAGVVGLVDKRAVPPKHPLGRLDPRIRDVMIQVLNAQEKQSSKPRKHLVRQVRREVLRTFPTEGLRIPSDQTLQRHMKTLDKGYYSTGNAYNRRSRRRKPKRPYRPRRAFYPGMVVEFDTSHFDFLVIVGYKRIRDPKTGIVRYKPRTGRARLVVLLDDATESIVASMVRVGEVTGGDLSFLLAQAVVLPPLRPASGFVPELADLPTSVMPWARGVDEERLAKLEARRPLIIPETVVTDNGKNYLSDAVKSALKLLEMNRNLAPVYTPTGKPRVERAFKTIETEFAPHIPGFTGGSPDRRGEDPPAEKLLDIYTLAELFDRWITVVWQNQQHGALRDPLEPQIVHSPNTMYMASSHLTGTIPMTLGPDDYIALLPTVNKPRLLQDDGFQVGYRQYNSPRLDLYRERPAADRHKWTIHFHPHDPRAVWVRDPQDASWIRCDWIDQNMLYTPFAASIRKEAKRIANEVGFLDAAGVDDATHELVARTGSNLDAFRARLEKANTNVRLGKLDGHNFPITVPEPEPEPDAATYEYFPVLDEDL